MENKDLKTIKKLYGENFTRLCRSNFSTILEQEELLPEILQNVFEPTHSLYEDLINNDKVDEFVDYINAYYNIRQKNIDYSKLSVNMTAKELLDKAGYILYPECKTEEDIQSFRKYYKKEEEICTFWTNRLETSRVWFAVKKDVDSIKRQDFKYPKREDAYGTSVISIQFTKGTYNNLSIKNRYNHTVINPDATFSNNLDNIIPGLMSAFIRDYGLNNVSSELQSLDDIILLDYYTSPEGKKYRYNLAYNNRYFCENNIIFDENGQQYKYDGNMCMVVDDYIFDFYNANVYNPFDGADNTSLYSRLYTVMGAGNDRFINEFDSFPRALGNIEMMSIKKGENKTKIITVTPYKMKDVVIVIDKHNAIIEYHNPNIKKLPNNFMRYNHSLEVLDLPNAVEIGDNCLHANNCALKINLPKVKKIGYGFLFSNFAIESLDLPSVTKISDKFLFSNEKLHTFNSPKLKYVGEDFMLCNHYLTQLYLPSLEYMNDSALCYNSKLKNIHLPRLKRINGVVFQNLTNSAKIYAPKCKNIERNISGVFIER